MAAVPSGNEGRGTAAVAARRRAEGWGPYQRERLFNSTLDAANRRLRAGGAELQGNAPRCCLVKLHVVRCGGKVWGQGVKSRCGGKVACVGTPQKGACMQPRQFHGACSGPMLFRLTEEPDLAKYEMSTAQADLISAEEAASSSWADLCVAEVLLPGPLWPTAGRRLGPSTGLYLGLGQQHGCDPHASLASLTPPSHH
eukprot:365678-Chlamydomonas_euryale.AAC.6